MRMAEEADTLVASSMQMKFGPKPTFCSKAHMNNQPIQSKAFTISNYKSKNSSAKACALCDISFVKMSGEWTSLAGMHSGFLK